MHTKHWTHSVEQYVKLLFFVRHMLTWDVLQAMKSWVGPGNKAIARLVLCGQTLFRTEGKGLGHGHRAACRPASWSAYQSQHSIQSHDTWSMWLTGKFKISVWIEREPEAWEVRTEREVSWDINWNTADSKSRVQKGRKS